MTTVLKTAGGVAVKLKRWIYRLIFLMALTLVWLMAARPWQYLPPAWNPEAPVAITHSMNPVTLWKLSRLGRSPGQCLEVLASVPTDAVDYLPLADYTPVASCPLSNVVRVRNTSVGFNAPFTVACPLLVRWIMFEQQRLQPLALQHLDSKISSIEHYGSFACRNINGRNSGRRSRHATASALDVAEFRLDNGVVVNVRRDWDNVDAPRSSEFLHDVHESACAYFGTVLGPEYNGLHADHFHFDTGGFPFCR
jgi:hypothetical protein